MNKKEIQQRVFQNGKLLELSRFTWDKNARVFSTTECGLIIYFIGIDHVTFKTGANCTFKASWNCIFNTGPNCTFYTNSNCVFKTGPNCVFNTGSICTFDTDSECTFKTGSGCVFNTGPNCVFNTNFNCIFNTGPNCVFKTSGKSVVIRNDIFEIIELLPNIIIQLAPDKIPGYIKNNIYSVTGKPAISVDGILSHIIKQKGNLYHVINYGENEKSYLVVDGLVWSHGKSLKDAKESLKYKLVNRDTTFCRHWKPDEKIRTNLMIRAYRAITGACESQTRAFCESHNLPKTISAIEAIKLTEGQPGSNQFKAFWNHCTYPVINKKRTPRFA